MVTFFSRPNSMAQPKKLREAINAVNNVARIPIVNATAKPFTGPVAFQKRIRAVIKVVMFESKMAGNAFSNAERTTAASGRLSDISSRNRS